jgi:hypothetical protein
MQRTGGINPVPDRMDLRGGCGTLDQLAMDSRLLPGSFASQPTLRVGDISRYEPT